MDNTTKRGRPAKVGGKGASKYCCYGTCNSDTRKLANPSCETHPAAEVPKTPPEYYFISFPKPCLDYRKGTVNDAPHILKCESCLKSLKWIRSCKRVDGRFDRLEHITKDTYICSLHFVGRNGPTQEFPDPVPPVSASDLFKIMNNNGASPEEGGAVVFSLSERLKAIERVKLGENSDDVAKSLGIPGHRVRQWIYQLAITDWTNGSKVGHVDHDLLDRALYTWFVQKMQYGAAVSRTCLLEQAKTFAIRLYGNLRIVSEEWMARWQARHKIEVPDDLTSSPPILNGVVQSVKLKGDADVIIVEEEEEKSPKKMKTFSSCDNGDDIIYSTDFDVLTAIEQTLRSKHLAKYSKHLESFLNLIETNGKAVEKLYDVVQNKVNAWQRMLISGNMDIDSMLNDIQKQNGVVVNGQISVNEKTSSNLTVNQVQVAGDVNDIIHVGQCSLERPNLPPIGQVHRKKLAVGMKVYAMKVNSLGVWYKARIIQINAATTPGGEAQYKIKFESRRMFPNRRLLAKHLAYCEAPSVILPVGSRVIAYYKDEYGEIGNALYAGVIAEPPKKINTHRYLVFFDDGYAQYVKHTEVYLVCEANKDVWEDIHPESREFIKAYLQQYPERPMVKLQTGQVVKTEWMGQWWSAKVVEVDASLVKMYFEADKRTEWIYRGSTRLAPLFHELANAEANRLAGKTRRHNLVAKRKHQPYVEYTRGLDEPMVRNHRHINHRPQLARKHIHPMNNQNVARKSTTQDKIFISDGSILLPQGDSHSGETVSHKLTIRTRIPYITHTCSFVCLKEEQDPVRHRDQNPLRIPMLCGWQREIVKHRRLGKRQVFYKTPCGRRLRSMPELVAYLWVTESKLRVDLFSFDSYVHAFSEFKPAKILAYIKDITYGKEDMQVCCVNSLDNGYPPYIEYSSKRYSSRGVELNLDPEFLCGCDCEDNCLDTSKCQCHSLTLSATEAMPSGRNNKAGYKFGRLTEPLITGVFECNSRCKCKTTCMNRVAQNGIQIRLQVFKTEQKGWGIRCLDDLPQGMFICNYAGQLLNEQGANEDGNQYGDEYQAELDHIEVVERNKEGYESDVADEPSAPKEEVRGGGGKSREADSAEDSDSDSAESPSNELAARDTDSDFDADLPLEMEVASRYSTRSKGKSRQRSENKAKSVAQKADTIIAPSKFLSAELSPETLRKLEKIKIVKRPHASTSDKEWITDSDDEKVRDEKDASSSPPHELETPDTSSGRPSLFGNLPDPTKAVPAPVVNNERKFISLRSYFNEEYCYIMDAKNCGNIGRYLNHSCSPNVFVQNVFVDSHDLRFPWVSFFAATFIRAGTELTWDYNYEVGSVPNKRMLCFCGTSDCRGRLL